MAVVFSSGTERRLAVSQFAPAILRVSHPCEWRRRCSTHRVENSIRKSAFVAYIALCVYFIAQPSASRLADRANLLDRRFAGEPRAALEPALAAALRLPSSKVNRLLQRPGSRPSDVILQKLLEECGAPAETERSPQGLLDAGFSASKAMDYFDDVEKAVASELDHSEKPRAVAHGRNSSPSRTLAETLRSQPD